MIKRIAEEPASESDKRSKIECLIRSVFKTAFEGDMKAVDIILERGWGKPVQPVDGLNLGPLFTIVQAPQPAAAIPEHT